MTTGQKWALGTLLSGLAVAVGGGIALSVSSRRRAGALGRVEDDWRARYHGKSGAELNRYRGPMPTADRIRLIDQRVQIGMSDPDMRKLALYVTKDCPARDDACELQAIWDFMRDGKHAPTDSKILKSRFEGVRHVRYTGDAGATVVKDERTGEVYYEPQDVFQAPQRTLEYGGGDCDDHTSVALTLAAWNGFDVRKAVTAPTVGAPDQHIYGEVRRRGEWIPFDTTLPYAHGPGVEHPYGRKRVWPGPQVVQPK